MFVRGKLKAHERQVRRFVGSSRNRRQRRSKLCVIKRRPHRPMRSVINHKLHAFRSHVAIPKALAWQPLCPHLVVDQRPRVIRHEFFSALIICGSQSALPRSFGLPRRAWRRHTNGRRPQQSNSEHSTSYRHWKCHTSPHSCRTIFAQPSQLGRGSIAPARYGSQARSAFVAQPLLAVWLFHPGFPPISQKEPTARIGCATVKQTKTRARIVQCANGQDKRARTDGKKKCPRSPVLAV